MKIKKIISIIILINFITSFVLNEALYAVIQINTNNENKLSLEKLKSIESPLIPKMYGKISKSKYYGSEKVIINIQDLHCHTEVQKNISKILSILDEKYNLNKVYVEGASGEIDTSWISNISDKKLEYKMIEMMINQGKLTGTEYYSILSGKPRLIYGIEDEKIYRDNFLRLDRISKNIKQYKNIINFLEMDLNITKNRYFNPDNKKFDKIVKKYKKGEVSPEKFYKKLLKYVKNLNNHKFNNENIIYININEYENINNYLNLLYLNKNLNYSKISEQLQKLVLLLNQRLSPDEYEFLLNKIKNNKFEELYTYLPEVVKKYRINLDNEYKQIKQFFEYKKKNHDLNSNELIAEERKLIMKIRAGLSKDIYELEVDFLADFFYFFKDYLTNNISIEDYEYFSNRFDRFKLLWEKYSYKDRLTDYKADFELFNEYYKYNLERNDYFIKNILENENKNSSNYHAELVSASNNKVLPQSTEPNLKHSNINKNRFPRNKYGAGSVKHGMTNVVSFLRKQESNLNDKNLEVPGSGAIYLTSDNQSNPSATSYTPNEPNLKSNTTERQNTDDFKEILNKLEKTKEVIVVVAGGFHTNGLEKIFDDKKISYLTITPNLTQNTINSDKVYLELTKQQAKILSQMLAPMLASMLEKMAGKSYNLNDEQLIAAQIALLENIVGTLRNENNKDFQNLEALIKALMKSIDVLDGINLEISDAIGDTKSKILNFKNSKGVLIIKFNYKNGVMKIIKQSEDKIIGVGGDDKEKTPIQYIIEISKLSLNIFLLSANLINSLSEQAVYPFETLSEILVLINRVLELENDLIEEFLALPPGQQDLKGLNLIKVENDKIFINLNYMQNLPQQWQQVNYFHAKKLIELQKSNDILNQIQLTIPFLAELLVSYTVDLKSNEEKKDLALKTSMKIIENKPLEESIRKMADSEVIKTIKKNRLERIKKLAQLRNLKEKIRKKLYIDRSITTEENNDKDETSKKEDIKNLDEINDEKIDQSDKQIKSNDNKYKSNNNLEGIYSPFFIAKIKEILILLERLKDLKSRYSKKGIAKVSDIEIVKKEFKGIEKIKSFFNNRKDLDKYLKSNNKRLFLSLKINGEEVNGVLTNYDYEKKNLTLINESGNVNDNLKIGQFSSSEPLIIYFISTNLDLSIDNIAEYAFKQKLSEEISYITGQIKKLIKDKDFSDKFIDSEFGNYLKNPNLEDDDTRNNIENRLKNFIETYEKLGKKEKEFIQIRNIINIIRKINQNTIKQNGNIYEFKENKAAYSITIINEGPRKGLLIKMPNTKDVIFISKENIQYGYILQLLNDKLYTYGKGLKDTLNFVPLASPLAMINAIKDKATERFLRESDKKNFNTKKRTLYHVTRNVEGISKLAARINNLGYNNIIITELNDNIDKKKLDRLQKIDYNGENIEVYSRYSGLGENKIPKTLIFYLDNLPKNISLRKSARLLMNKINIDSIKKIYGLKDEININQLVEVINTNDIEILKEETENSRDIVKIVIGEKNKITWKELKNIDIFFDEKDVEENDVILDNLCREALNLKREEGVQKGYEIIVSINYKMLLNKENMILFKEFLKKAMIFNVRLYGTTELKEEALIKLMTELRKSNENIRILGEYNARENENMDIIEKKIINLINNKKFNGIEINLSKTKTYKSIDEIDKIIKSLNNISDNSSKDSLITVMLPEEIIKKIDKDELTKKFNENISLVEELEFGKIAGGRNKCVKIKMKEKADGKNYDIDEIFHKLLNDLEKNGAGSEMYEISFEDSGELFSSFVKEVVKKAKELISEDANMIYNIALKHTITGNKNDYDTLRKILRTRNIILRDNNFNNEVKKAKIDELISDMNGFINNSEHQRSPFTVKLNLLLSELNENTKTEIAAKIIALIKGEGVNILLKDYLDKNKKNGFIEDLDGITFGELAWFFDGYELKDIEKIIENKNKDKEMDNYIKVIHFMNILGKKDITEELLTKLQKNIQYVINNEVHRLNYMELMVNLGKEVEESIKTTDFKQINNLRKVQLYYITGQYENEMKGILKDVIEGKSVDINNMDPEKLLIYAQGIYYFGGFSYEATIEYLNKTKEKIKQTSGKSQDPMILADEFRILDLLSDERLKFKKNTKNKNMMIPDIKSTIELLSNQ